MTLEIVLATMAHAIRLSTIEWPSIISMTMMNDVNGACVAAAKRSTMPSAIGAVACGTCSSCATSLPSAAPIASDGAKMPAGTPDQLVSQVR